MSSVRKNQLVSELNVSGSIEELAKLPPNEFNRLRDFCSARYFIRYIFDEYGGIDLPYCLNLDVIVEYLEEKVKVAELLVADKPIEEIMVPYDPTDGQRWLNLFQQTFPPAYYELFREKLHEVRKMLDDFVVSAVIDRRRPRVQNYPPNHRKGLLSTANVVKDAEHVTYDPFSHQNMTIPKPDFIPAAMWERYSELGNTVVDYILDAFAVFASGDFSIWKKHRTCKMNEILGEVKGEKEKKRRNLVCEYILVEKMKKREFFCCDVCNMAFFNHKQTLLHFTDIHNYHSKRETAELIYSGIDKFDLVLYSFTNLPTRLREEETKIAQDRTKRNCVLSHLESMSLLESDKAHSFTPNNDFKGLWSFEFLHLVDTEAGYITDPKTGQTRFSVLFATRAVVDRVKSDIGREAMTKLHEHLEEAPPICALCNVKLDDRKDFYAHFCSHAHIFRNNSKFKRCTNEPNSFDLVTVLVNVLAKEFI